MDIGEPVCDNSLPAYRINVRASTPRVNPEDTRRQEGAPGVHSAISTDQRIIL